MFDALRGSEVAWLISIARSRGIDRLRARRIRVDREDEAGREISTVSGFVDRTSGADKAIQAEQSYAVRGALAELPDAQRRALELAYFEGLSQSEIADRLHEPLGTVAARYEKAARSSGGISMTHDEIEAIAALDALGAATPEERREMNAHMAGCDSCRRARDEYAESPGARA